MQILDKPYITVIVPCYNCEDSLKRAVESVINQSIGFDKIELILTDNGSIDSTKSIIEKYSEEYENIIPFFIKNNTGSAAIPRNIGIENSSAEYIMFLDSDDEFMNDFCETMYNKITQTRTDLVKCNFITVTDDNEVSTYYFDEEIKETIIKNKDLPLDYVTIWNGIHKSEILKNNNITFPDYMGEDICFTTEEFLNINEMLYLNDYFGYKYYYYENSHAKDPSKDKIISLIKAFKKTRDICKDYEREDVMNFILGTQILGIYFRINNTSEHIHIKKELLKETYSLVKTMPHLIIQSKVYKFANLLVMKKLFYLTILYLKIAPTLYRSKLIKKLINP